MPANEPLDYGRWIDGVRDGRSYCCDGRTHLIDFEINGLGVGQPGDEGRISRLAIHGGQRLKIKCKAAGLLPEQPTQLAIHDQGPYWGKQPAWHIERARIEGTRRIPVELIVNGQAVDSKQFEADGRVEEIEFTHTPERSSWIALRVFPAAHTNPIFVEVDDKPIRASKRSAQWCLDAVDRCWTSKSPQIRETERQTAREAYDHAKAVYAQIREDAFDDRDE
jgi:hypothetical protein